ncbi:MAG: glycosyltransferase family 4 protein [Planctomycetota bacterium]|jgi:glycosyltransferase involved in cell wall biosynthesis
MKIAFVLHQFLPHFNSGTEQYVYHLAKKLRNRGEDVKVFCFEPKAEGNPPFTGVMKDTFEDIPVTRVSGWPGYFPNIVLSHYYNPFYGKVFADFLKEEGIELVHSFQNERLSVAVIEEAFLAGIPCLVNLMDFWYLCPHIQLLRSNSILCEGPFDYKECIHCRAPHDSTYQALYPYIYGEEAVPLSREAVAHASIDFLAGSDPYHMTAAMAVRPHFIRRTLGLADLLISPSEFLKSVFVANGYDPQRFALVRYGIELKDLQGITKERTPQLRVGYIGTIVAHKGLDVLVKAFRRITGDRLSLEVHGDMKAFPEYAAQVEELADGDSRVHFHGRFEAPELAGVLQGIDVLVVPSVWYENTPFVILEALASGTPVIASDLGGLSELIEEGDNGLLFKPGDHEELKKRIESMIEDRSLIENYHAGAASVRSLDDNVDEFLAIYCRSLDDRKEAGRTEREGKQAMDPERPEKTKQAEILERQNHHLMSQLFHLIGMNSGYVRRIGELEGVIDDKMFLAEHGPVAEEAEIPRDLSPSIQRKLLELEQIRAVLERRNIRLAELERQLETYRVNALFQDNRLKDQDDDLKDLNEALAGRDEEIQNFKQRMQSLESEIEQIKKRFLFKVSSGVKGLLKGGSSG